MKPGNMDEFSAKSSHQHHSLGHEARRTITSGQCEMHALGTHCESPLIS